MESRRSLRRAVIFVGFLATAAIAADVKYEVDRAKVYHGNSDAFAKPAVVKSLTVFQNIKAYKTIEDEKVPNDSARYYLLLKEANEVFKTAVETVAKKEGVDLVAEVGGVKAEKDKVAIPDLTQKLVKAVEGK